LGGLVALLLAAAPEANLSLLRPASGTDGLLGVEGARPTIPAENPLQLQLGFDAQYKPVRLGPGARIDSRLAGWAQLAARLEDDFTIFAQLPVTLHQSGDLSALGAAQPELGFAVGDVRLGLRHGFLHGPIDVQGQISLEAATAARQSLTGEDRLVGEALVSAAQRRGQWELIGNAYVRFRPPRDVGPAQLGNELGLRGGAAYWFSPRSRAYGELELQSSLRELSQHSLPVEWRAGGTACATSALAVDVGGGTRLDDGLGAPSVRGVVAVRYAPQLCKPAKREGPEPGIQELVARIAQERAAREKAEQLERMPRLLAQSEVAAREALTRAQARDLLAASEADALARARALAEEDTRDSDGDGVPDRLDNCPYEKGPPENHGCPRTRRQIVILREDRIEILDRVYFEPGKVRIQPRSTRLLDQVAAVLQSHPELVRIQVEGHTDDRGSPAFNQKLSQARAESVVRALVQRRIAPERLVARGFGLTRPVASNATRQGREKNRRVEFRVVQRRLAGQVIELE
jgi:OmpA-OmpF porin, OOP family